MKMCEKMGPVEKVTQLRSLIRQALLPLIDRDYVLLDLPYHQNVGDTLIWQGELDFLKETKHKCLYAASLAETELHFPKETLILFQGGGNFGDFWPAINEYRKTIIARHPDNPVIIFPQSVGYQDDENLQRDAAFFRNYKNVTICVRDLRSKEILDRHFGNNTILLVPDMAFMLNVRRFRKKRALKGSVLFCKRADREFAENARYKDVPASAVLGDWLYPENKEIMRENYWAHRIANSIDIRFKTSFYPKVNDWIWRYRYKDSQIQYAVDFVSPYETVYTTRLHVSILSILLGKTKVVLFDNRYGKLSSFYHTWLQDLDCASLQ